MSIALPYPVSMKQFACPSKPGLERLAAANLQHVLEEHLALEVRDRAGLRRRQVGRVAEGEDVR
jgi:hypothetical protein